MRKLINSSKFLIIFCFLTLSGQLKSQVPQQQAAPKFSDRPAFCCEDYPLYENLDPSIYCNSIYDSADRVNYALKYNYQYIVSGYESRKKYFHNRWKGQFTSMLNGLLDTAKIHQLLHFLKNNPDSSHLSAVYSILTCNIVCRGAVTEMKLEYDTSVCHPLKTKCLIRIDSIYHTSVKSIEKGDTVLAGTMNGYVGGCAKGNPSTILYSRYEAKLKQGQSNLFMLTNATLLDEQYTRCNSDNPTYEPGELYFCQNLLRIRYSRGKQQSMLKNFLNYDWH